MAVPGFSVSDLIQALGQAKLVYDAFFNKYTNTASQLRSLRDDIEMFRERVTEHQKTVQAHGLDYSGYRAAASTVEACCDFLERYRAAETRRKRSFAGAFQTAKYVFDADEVERLRAQIAAHRDNLMLFSLNYVLLVTDRKTPTSAQY